MAKKGQSFNKYARDLVEFIVKEKLEYGISYSKLSKKYNIPEGTISGWVHKYTRSGWDFSDRRGKNLNQDIDYKMRYKIAKKFLTFLKQEL